MPESEHSFIDVQSPAEVIANEGVDFQDWGVVVHPINNPEKIDAETAIDDMGGCPLVDMGYELGDVIIVECPDFHAAMHTAAEFEKVEGVDIVPPRDKREGRIYQKAEKFLDALEEAGDDVDEYVHEALQPENDTHPGEALLGVVDGLIDELKYISDELEDELEAEY